MWPSAGAPTFGSASATICAPSSGVNAGSSLSNPTSCFRPGRREIRQRERALADEIGLRHRDHPAHAEIVGGDRAVRILPDDDEALLGAQRQQDVHAIGDGAALLSLRPYRLEHAERVVRGRVDLEAQFTREADAREPDGNAAGKTLAHAQMRERLQPRDRRPSPAAR